MTTTSADLEPSDQASGTSTGPQNLARIWFQDGNVIFKAGDTQFRVYRGLLAEHSEVWRNLFADASTDGSQMHDGCPVIELQDSSREFEHFLRAIFYPFGFLDNFAEAPPYASIDVLKLCDKYQVHGRIRHTVLQHLSSFYPTSLDELVSRQDLTSLYWKWGSGGQNQETIMHFRVLKLAIDLGFRWMIPFALYRCAVLASVAQLCDGIRVSETETVYLDETLSRLCLDLQRRGPLLANLGLIDYAVQSVVETCRCYYATQAYNYIHTLTGTTVSSRHCPSGRFKLIQQSLLLSILDITTDPRDEALDWARLGICDRCIPNLEEKFRAGRQEFWIKLPLLCNLPDWAQLEAEKRSGLQMVGDIA